MLDLGPVSAAAHDNPGGGRRLLWFRYPLYVDWRCIFWGTPLMSIGHLLFYTPSP